MEFCWKGVPFGFSNKDSTMDWDRYNQRWSTWLTYRFHEPILASFPERLYQINWNDFFPLPKGKTRKTWQFAKKRDKLSVGWVNFSDACDLKPSKTLGHSPWTSVFFLSSSFFLWEVLELVVKEMLQPELKFRKLETWWSPPNRQNVGRGYLSAMFLGVVPCQNGEGFL